MPLSWHKRLDFDQLFFNCYSRGFTDFYEKWQILKIRAGQCTKTLQKNNHYEIRENFVFCRYFYKLFFQLESLTRNIA